MSWSYVERQTSVSLCPSVCISVSLCLSLTPTLSLFFSVFPDTFTYLWAPEDRSPYQGDLWPQPSGACVLCPASGSITPALRSAHSQTSCSQAHYLCLWFSLSLYHSLSLPSLPLVVSSILLPPAAPGETKPVKMTPLGVAFHQWASCLVFFFLPKAGDKKKNGGITHTSVRDGGEHRPASLNLPQREGTLCDTSDDAPFHSPPLTPVTAADGWPV